MNTKRREGTIITCTVCGKKFPWMRETPNGHRCYECYRVARALSQRKTRQAHGCQPRPARYTVTLTERIVQSLDSVNNLAAEYQPPLVRYCHCCGKRLPDTSMRYCDAICLANYQAAEKKPLPTPFIRVEMQRRSH